MVVTPLGGYILLGMGIAGVVGMILAFLVARYNDHLDGPDHW